MDVDGQSGSSQNLKGFVPLVLISQVLGLGAVVITAIWMGSFGSGFAWTPTQVFNYHPLFMVIGMIFLYAESILSYRIFRNNRKLSIKILHAALHILALIFAIIGLRAVFYAHSNSINMYSLHSWVGLGSVILFGFQWLMGFVAFLFPKLPEGTRAALMPIHRVCGIMIFTLALTAALMGINEKNIHTGKYPKLETAEVLGNILGIVLALFGIVVCYIVTTDGYRRIDPITDGHRRIDPITDGYRLIDPIDRERID